MRPALTMICLLALAAGSFLRLDGLTAPATPTVHASGAASSQPTTLSGTRIFVLLVDSLRYQTAVDPQRMPCLSSRSAGFKARVAPSFDAITVMSIRAAFTGRDRVTVMGFAQNYGHGDLKLPSVLTQLRALGGSTVVFSDGAFRQFAPDIRERRPILVGTEGAEDTRQLVGLQQAKARFAAGQDTLVLAHLTFTDHAAHAHGTGAPAYNAAFALADAEICRLDQLLGPNDGLIVFGDHGHDAAGRHMTGIEAPTFLWARGPRWAHRPFDPKAPLDLQLTELRYLLGWGLGVPLAADYTGPRRPELLRATADDVTGAPLGPAYGTADAGAPRQASVPADRRSALALLVALIGLFAAAAWRDTPRGSWICVLAAAASFVPSVWVHGAAVLIGLAALGSWRVGLWLLAAGAVALWGGALSAFRPLAHYPEYRTMGPILVAGGLVIAAVSRALPNRPLAFTWMAGGCIALAYPTVYRYGGPALMVPALWILLAASADLRKLPHGLLAVICSAPFLFAYAHNYQFVEWDGPLLDDALGLAQSPLLTVALCVAAFDHPRIHPGDQRGVRGRWWLAGAGWAAFQLGVPGAGWATLAAATLAVFTTGAPRQLAICAAAAYGAIATDALRGDAMMWFTALLVAFRHTALAMSRRRVLSPAADWLPLLGVLAVGWCTLRWSFQPLEWAFIYNWVPADLVERNAFLFMPLIGLRYALPLVVLRIVVGDALGAPLSRAAFKLGVVKGSIGLVIALGIALHSAGTQVHLEAVQQASIWIVLLFGLVPAYRQQTTELKENTG